jgi:cytochrome b subunit of formate dehydrogenase
LAADNRLQTCRQCHANAVANFAKFDPHASYKDAQGYPFLHGIYHWLERIIYLLVGLFVLHMVCWFTRSFFYARRHGRDRPCVAGGPAIVSSERVNRVVYSLLLVSFIGLVLTGLPLKYGIYPWAKRIADLVGGFGTTSIWHHAFAVLLLATCGVHLVRACRTVRAHRQEGTGWKALLRSPEGPIPSRRDLRDMLRMAVWFVGLGRKPKFERWTYWEKFDYWAVYAALAVIAIPGLMLWFPNFFCLFLPGTVLNVAKVVHSEIALMAAGFVFMIHVFNTHLRPEKFPLDVSWFTGVVSEEHLIKSRPDYLRRLQAEGKLEAMRTCAPARQRLRRVYLQAACLLGAGLCVLAVVVLVSLSK